MECRNNFKVLSGGEVFPSLIRLPRYAIPILYSGFLNVKTARGSIIRCRAPRACISNFAKTLQRNEVDN